MRRITKIGNRYWLDDFLIYRVHSYSDLNYDNREYEKCYKIITCWSANTDNPANTDVHKYYESELSNEDIVILDKLEQKRRRNNKVKRHNNANSLNFNYHDEEIKKMSVIGSFIDKLTDIANFRF